MGCCEVRDGAGQGIPTHTGIRRMNKTLMSQRLSSKRVSFLISETGELRHSLSKRVFSLSTESDPILASLAAQVEDLLFSPDWDIHLNEDSILLKSRTHSVFGEVYFTQLSLDHVVQLEYALCLFNGVTFRPAWDNELVSMSLVDGHALLDGKVVMHKRGSSEAVEYQRFVREYRNRLVLFETEDELEQCQSFTCVFILTEKDSTSVEVISTGRSSVNNTYRVKRLWASRLYQELSKDPSLMIETQS